MGLFGCFCTSETEWRFSVCKYAGLVYSVVAKITSEEVALEYGRRIGLDVVTKPGAGAWSPAAADVQHQLPVPHRVY
jgi:hypothetical protein